MNEQARRSLLRLLDGYEDSYRDELRLCAAVLPLIEAAERGEPPSATAVAIARREHAGVHRAAPSRLDIIRRFRAALDRQGAAPTMH